MDTHQKIVWAVCVCLFVACALAIRAYVDAHGPELLSSVEREQLGINTAPDTTSAVNAVPRPPPGEFLPMPAPGPLDWLAAHDEPGQTFEQFLGAERNVPDTRRSTIYLLPLDTFTHRDDPSLPWLAAFTEAYFGMPVVLLPVLDDSLRTFETRLNPWGKQRQLHAGDILEQLMRRVPDDAYCMLAVTMVDLYPDESWNFVFGYAAYTERVGVFSFARYHPRFHAERPDSNSRSLVLLRSAKIIAHEVGHMFGMAHCTAYLCAMNGCNHLAEADRQPLHLCPVCRRKLAHAVGCDMGKRYRRLGGVYGSVGWIDDSLWVAAAAGNLDK